MSLKASTGLRNYMLITGSLKAALDLGFVRIYAGAVPADADAAIADEAGQRLCTITKDGDGTTGLTIASTASSGTVTKANEVWQGTNSATGTATFWRFYKTGDTGGASTSLVRLQGLAATSGSELVMTSTSLVSGAPQAISYFSVSLPA